MAKPGPLFIKISPEMIKVPRRVSILEIDPASFTVAIEKRIEKSVPIVADLNKDPALGYIISRVVTTPSMAKAQERKKRTMAKLSQKLRPPI